MGVEINRAAGLPVDFATKVLRKCHVDSALSMCQRDFVFLVYVLSSTVPILLKSALWVLIIKIRCCICPRAFFTVQHATKKVWGGGPILARRAGDEVTNPFRQFAVVYWSSCVRGLFYIVGFDFVQV